MTFDREDPRILCEEAEEQSSQKDVQIMQMLVVILICGTNDVVELAHLLAGFDIGRMARVGQGLLIQAGQRQEELIVCLQVAEVKVSPVVDSGVISSHALEIGCHEEANLVFGNRGVANQFLNDCANILTFCYRSEVHVLSQTVVPVRNRNVAAIVRVLYVADGAGRERERLQKTDEEILAVRRIDQFLETLNNFGVVEFCHNNGPLLVT